MNFNAILIDAKARTVTEVLMDDAQDNLQQYYRYIGCDLVTAITLENGDTMWLDDEGLLKDPNDFFLLREYPEPLAGNALITGTRWDDEGDHVDHCKTTVEGITPNIKFMDRLTLALVMQMAKARGGDHGQS